MLTGLLSKGKLHKYSQFYVCTQPRKNLGGFKILFLFIML
ncbi:hypothetical protein CANDROIZ_390006 [Candidatus Roizmanbacteria bacterium]|nr:hypothetical protein CANDROIZ_390006 [Candidatus Roizmanbacteria bacterium]